jgi:hypothetical protein
VLFSSCQAALLCCSYAPESEICGIQTSCWDMAVRKLSTGFGQIWLKVSIFGITKFNSIYLTRRRENNPHSEPSTRL